MKSSGRDVEEIKDALIVDLDKRAFASESDGIALLLFHQKGGGKG